MRFQRSLLILTCLAFSNPVFAQQHHPANHGGVHPGGAAVHPGQQHMMPHQMTPQQHQNMVHQQMWNDQMLFESIMNSRGGSARRNAAATQSGPGKQAPRNNQAQPSAGAGKGQNGSNAAQTKNGQAQGKAKQKQPKQVESPGNVSKQPKQEHEKEAKAKEAAERKKAHELEKSLHQRDLRNTRNVQGSDSASINHLKNALQKLRTADHDYAGHRVQSMHHVARALDHLTGSFAFDHVGSGAGNLPQAESDRLLREAEGHLRSAENALPARTHNLEHHRNARTAVAEAIHELRIALNIN